MITATANDNVGGSGVSRVQFFINGTTPAACRTLDDTAPYTCQWAVPLTSPAVGHIITAKAWDNAGNARTSAAIRVTGR